MMKARRIFLGVLAIAAATTAGLVACKKNIADHPADRPLTAGIQAVCDCSNTYEKDSTLTGSINADLTLRAAVHYKLSGLVFVVGNHTLTIQQGTTILGVKATGSGVGGGLVITRGSKIVASGTSSCPIVFTSDQASPASGDWAGVVILGKAQTNNAGATGAFVEGIDNTSYPGIDLQYGSADSVVSSVNVNNDSSGVLRCVRIEYAGFALSLNNEINGLTLAGVGRKTVLDYIDVYKANDDAFEFFGGCVNASHLIAVDALDDMFDTDNGYTGSISFALGLADQSRKDQSQSNGFETDNNSGGTHPANSPITHPHYSNITIIGVDSLKAHSDTTIAGLVCRYGRGGHFRRWSDFDIKNSIVFGFNYGISIDSQLLNSTSNSLVDYNAALSSLDHVYAAGYGTPATGSVGPWSIESNGVAETGLRFYASYTPTSGLGNVGVRSSSANPFNFVSPYNRSSVSNLVPGVGQASRAYGAFPAGSTSWTNPDGCGTNNWLKLQ